jgi:5-methylcytosine-specific restriction endonuclease McrA
MKRAFIAIGLIFALMFAPYIGSAITGSYSSNSSTTSHHGVRKKASGVKRDKHGKIARSNKAKSAFRKKHPCPSTGRTSGKCPGYVVDHIVPLKRGGADNPNNMQWQTKAAAKAKDKIE